MFHLKVFTALALTLGVASTAFAQVGETFGKRPAPEGSKACERPEFFAKLTNLAHVDRDVAYWSVLEIKANVGETIPASSVLSNVAYRGDRPDAIRYEIGELGAFRNSTIARDDAEFFAVDPTSGALSWKKLPPPGKYDFALVVKAFDAERPELFDEILVTFAISIKLTPPPAPKIDLLQSVGDVSTFDSTPDVATDAPSNAPTLLDVVKTEAAQMDVFPKTVFLHRVAQPLPAIRSYFLDADFYKVSPFFHPFYEGDLLLGRGICYDLTFEEYLVFYRFKTAACYAAPHEIDECVAKFDEMSPKERALVLTAIQLWREAQINSRFVRSAQKFLEERGDRGSLPHLATVSAPSLYPCVQLGEQVFLPGDYATPDLQSMMGRNNRPDWSRFVWKNYSRRLEELNGDEQVASWKAFERWQCEQVPRYIIRNGCLLPVDVPEFSVDAATEERWNRLIESCVESEEIAFEQLDLDLEETKRAWEADCRERLAEVGELFNVELPEWHVAQRFKKPDSTIYYSYAERFFERDKLNVGGDELRYWEALTAFFDAVEAQKKAEPQSEATRRAVALQEFWFACQRTAPVGDETPKDGLQSARPLTLGEIAKDCLPLQTPARQKLREFPKSDGPIVEVF